MKKLLIALGILAALVVLAGIAILILVDVNAHKPRIESAVSSALGMEFRIRGKARLRLFPSASVVLSDVLLRNRRHRPGHGGGAAAGCEACVRSRPPGRDHGTRP